MRRLVAAVLILATAMGCSPTAPPTGTPAQPLPSAPTVQLLGTRVEISPGAALLTGLGQTRGLTAQAFDATGDPVEGSATWTSSRPEAVEVDASGTITARGLGTSQVVATVNGVASAPAMIVVAELAPGVKLVADEQVTGLASTDASSYELSFRDLTLAPGDLVAASGEQPIAGRVQAVDGSKATIDVIPLNTLVPGLAIEESIDLANASVHVPVAIANLYDITRDATTFTFTPKPDFMERLPSAPTGASGARLVTYRGGDDGSGETADGVTTAAVSGTYMLPFEECKSALTGVGDSFPLTLSAPPVFSVDVNPSLDVLSGPDGGLVHWLVRAAPRATLDVGLTLTAQLEGKIECKATYFEFRIPISGLLSVFISGIVPVGVGFELGGKITLATSGLTAKATATTTAALGVDCSPGTCQLVNTLGDVNVEPEWTFDAPSIGDLRIEPSFAAFGFVEAKLGNVFLALDVAKAKVGAKLEASWAPRVSQIADRTYRSDYGFSVEAEATVGSGLGAVGERLGVGEITFLEFKHSEDLYHSPTAVLTLDRQAYEAGDSGVATVHFDPPDNLKVLGLAYNVDSVVLVVDTSVEGGELGYEELAVVVASENQVDFQLPFTASDAIDAGRLHAFVIPKFLAPSDELALELAKAARLRLGFLQNATAVAVDPDGTNSGPLRLGASSPPAPLAVASPSGARWAYVNGGDLWVADADGSNAHRVGRAANRWSAQQYMSVTWSPDEARIAYPLDQPRSLVVVAIDGSGSVAIPTPADSDFFSPAWSPDGSQIAVEHLGRIYLVSPGGGSPTPITPDPTDCPTCVTYFSPAWSPDGSQLAVLGSELETGRTNVSVMDAGGGGITAITTDLGSALRAVPLAWSASGIAFAITTFEGNTPSYSVWGINPDGSDLRPLVGHQATVPAPYWFMEPSP